MIVGLHWKARQFRNKAGTQRRKAEAARDDAGGAGKGFVGFAGAHRGPAKERPVIGRRSAIALKAHFLYRHVCELSFRPVRAPRAGGVLFEISRRALGLRYAALATLFVRRRGRFAAALVLLVRRPAIQDSRSPRR